MTGTALANYDPDYPRSGTANGPGHRPGASKGGRPPSRRTNVEIALAKRDKRLAKMERAVKFDDLGRRAVELWLDHGPSMAAVAREISRERGEEVTPWRVQRAYLAQTKQIEKLDLVRYQEYTRLDEMANHLRRIFKEMTEGPPEYFDAEKAVKVAEGYLKYRERISKLLGLDAPVKQQVIRDDSPGSVHIGADGITITMPGSVSAFEDWQTLTGKGLTKVADQVLELEETEHTEIVFDRLHADGHAGVTLNPAADVAPAAERKVVSAIEALDLLAPRKDG